MTTFEVNDMTCGHCVSAITRGINAVAPGVDIQIDLAAHRVTVGASAVDAAQLRLAIMEAGYTPMAIEVAPGVAVNNASAPRSGCCCG